MENNAACSPFVSRCSHLLHFSPFARLLHRPSRGILFLYPQLLARLKLMPQADAIDVQGFEDSQNLIEGLAGIHGPEDDVEIFFARGELIENGIEEGFTVVKFALQKPEVAAI